MEQAKSVLAEYEIDYQSTYHERMRQKLDWPSYPMPCWLIGRACLNNKPTGRWLIRCCLSPMIGSSCLVKPSEQAQAWRESWLALNPDPDLARQHNPWVIARNHLVDHALRTAEDGDVEPFTRLLDHLKTPFDKPESEEWIRLPAPGLSPSDVLWDRIYWSSSTKDLR